MEQSHNREYKDRLFRFIFSDKQRALSLYNAVNGTDYADAEELTYTTLNDAIYMGMKNDLAFLLGLELNLYEHQSSVNPNMPLRGLIYLSRMYDTLVRTRKLNLYGKKLQKIPAPKYIVFYNGTDELPEQQSLRLSDAFQTAGGCMELTATVYNINAGRNAALMAHCLPLRDYALFVAAVRKWMLVASSVEEAIRQAIDECIQNNIMADILVACKAEVTDMLLTEYNEAEVMEMLREEAREEGREQGLEQGRAQGLEQGRAQGLEQGLEQGQAQGKIIAYSKMVNRGLLTIAEAAEDCKTTIAGFISAAEQYKCPIAQEFLAL